MTKKGKNKKNTSTAPEPEIQEVVEIVQPSLAEAPRFSPRLPYIIVFVLSCLIYSNTLWNKYAIDDAIVLTENNFTKKGFAGIKDLMTHDAFEGFFGARGSSLIQGGRYRPLSLVTFAIEYQLWGLNPAYSHAVNVLMFALTCVLIFYLLSLLAGEQSTRPFYLTWPFIAALLYAVHPIHTEAVANIKGRDEIIAMLLAIAALIFSVRYVKSDKISDLLIGAVIYCFALLSKENTITFLAIVPFTYYMFTDATKKQYITGIAAYLIPAVLFMFIRSQYAPTGILQESSEVLNNPFSLATIEQRYATIVLTWLYYIKLLFVPYPLSHDYYYNEIPYVGFSSIKTILSIIVNLGLVAYGIKVLREKSVLGYGILFYFITFSIVSNLLFTVGVLMNERFIFMPSLGFCIALAYLLTQQLDKNKLTANTALILVIVVSSLFSLKTFSRNYAWETNFSLLKTDVKSSPNSSKAHTTYGGLLIEESDKERDSTKRKSMLAESMENLEAAIKIYPTNSDAWLLMGNAAYKYNKDYNKAIDAYLKAFEYKGRGNVEALYNIALVQMENKMPALAKENLKKANALRPNQYKCIFNLAEAYAAANIPDSAIIWYKQAMQLQPNDAMNYHKVGVTYGKQMNRIDDALPWLNKAVELDPHNIVYLEDLAVANGIKGNFDGCIKAAQAILQINPNYISAYYILSTSYQNKGDKATADQYIQKAQALQGKPQ
jgi:tetratricopeptide (TPR) repeat protein